MYETHVRPWGFFTILHQAPDCKIKRLIVQPGHRLSLQKHQHRREVWIVLQGIGHAQIEHDLIPLSPQSIVSIEPGQLHRLSCENHSNEPLTLLEVQTGSYFGEDDIVRLEDDYQRIHDI